MSDKRRFRKAQRSKYFPEKYIKLFEEGFIKELESEKAMLKKKIKKDKVKISTFFDDLDGRGKLLLYKAHYAQYNDNVD